MFLVAGITGHVGAAAARALLDHGKQVRTLSRHPGRAASWAVEGVDVRTGDLGDPDALTRALAGVEGAFLLTPPTMTPSPDYREAKAVIAAYEQALAAAPPPRLVCLSSVGAEQTGSIGVVTALHLMEQALQDLSFPIAFVRPGAFYESFAPALDQVAATGVFDSLLQPVDRALPMAATADIGAVVTRLLADGWEGQEVVELGARTSPAELAAAMSEALGRPVEARAVPREHWTDALEAMGLPPGSTGPYEEMMDALNSGWVDWRAPNAERVEGTTSPVQVYATGR